MEKRRRLSHLYVFILGFIMLMGYSNIASAAASADDFYYNQSGTEVTITKYNGSSTEIDLSVVFPEASKIIIESNAFFDNESIQKVVLPSSVTSIGEMAFWGCSNLQSVTFSSEIESLTLGKGVFSGCTQLASLEIPDCVNAIPESMCEGCTSLSSIKLPESYTYIGKAAFWGCNMLKSIQISGSCTLIGERAFKDCEMLSSVSFETSSESEEEFILGEDVFSNCKRLTNISLPSGCTSIPISAFENCTSLKSITIPDSCTDIQENAFYQCKSLKNIEIPSACTSVGNYAFELCTGLNSVTFFNPDTSIGAFAFPALDSAPNLVIYCNQIGSVTIYAQSNGINYKTGVQSITLTKLPTVTEYMYSTNGSLDLTGMEVKAQVLSETSDNEFIYEDVDISECAISGFDSTKPGIQTITVAYAGKQASYKINVYYNLEKTTVTVDPVTYTGDNLKPSFVVYGNETGQGLRPETDYICTYQNNKNAGIEASITLTGTGFYKGEKTVSFIISPKSLEDNNTVITVEDMTYTGNQLCPVPVVTCDGKQLTSDKDYIVTYGANTDVGKGFVSVEGIGNYKGSVKQWFNIKAVSTDKTEATDTEKNDSGSTGETGSSANTTMEKPKKGKTYTCDNMYYKVTGSSTVTFMKPVKKNIKKIVIPDEVMINGWAFKVTKINKKACYKNKNITKVIVGNKVTHVGDMAFAYCSKLQNVTLGTGITHIGKKAMYQDTKMKRLNIKSKKLKVIGRYAFKGFKKNRISVYKKMIPRYNVLYKKAHE